MIKISNLSFSYDDDNIDIDSEQNIAKKNKLILNNLNLKIKKGTINTIIGLSGCGKTTLCHCLCGVIPQLITGKLTGKILLNNKNIAEQKVNRLAKQIGLVMQNPDNQLIATNVENELAFAPENMVVPREEIKERIDKTLALLKIENLRYANPKRLSGGQKKLVAIGAILTLKPEVLILDEPLSSLDEEGQKLILDILKILKEQGKTIIVVEHNYQCLDFADQWLFMADGEIKKMAPPQEMAHEIDFSKFI